jgi:hypothetical protein
MQSDGICVVVDHLFLSEHARFLVKLARSLRRASCLSRIEIAGSISNVLEGLSVDRSQTRGDGISQEVSGPATESRLLASKVVCGRPRGCRISLH